MVRLKKCFKCNAIKPLTEFYKHSQMADGHLNKCKECAKKDVHKHREQNIEQIKEYDRQRAKNRERIKLATEYTKQWRSADKRRVKCHNAVAREIKSGKLTREPCQNCGDTKTIAHHDDYNKPLLIRWFCQSCHIKHHQGKIE
jgi:ribosomal protein S27AE